MEQNKYLDITCKIMNAAMKGESLDLSAYDNDPEFLRIMKEQTFLPFLYEVDKRKIWRKYYYQAYLINEKFDQIGKKIKEIFDENNIDHIFLKGFELKKLYPKPWLRQMGDIDVLVREEDFEKASQLLKDNDFIFDHQIEYHSSFVIDNLNIELHNKLLSNTNSYKDFFKEPFTESQKTNANTFVLNENFNLIYLLAHYIKHLKNGAGVRELCDFYVLLKNKTYDLDYIKVVLTSEKCDKFLDTLLNEIDYIFNFKKYPYKKNEYFKNLLIYSLISGIHGFGENNNRAQNEYIKSKKSKFSYLTKKLFIPIKDLFILYPWTKSIVLLPIGYLCRFFYLLFKRKKELKSVLSTSKDDLILNKIGIE